jgi:predicted GNAT family acetyltransferase
VPDFWSAAGPLYRADPVRHTMAVTVIRGLLDAPQPGDPVPTLLTCWERGSLAAAAARVPPWPLLSSGLTDTAVEPVAEKLLEIDPGIPGVNGPRDIAETFGMTWSKLTGATVTEEMAQRLYRLDRLKTPVVRGGMRLATPDDVPLLARWLRDFAIEAIGAEGDPGRQEANVRRELALGNAQVLWVLGDQPASWAATRRPIERMSRVGPVYTPPDYRGMGFGSAATAAATRWTLDAGAEDVLLFTDLANAKSNAIYQRLGYRPMDDYVVLDFHDARPPTLEV